MRCLSVTLWATLALGLLAGCATRSGIAWNNRVGNYSYGQAVKDMGAPDKSMQRADYSTVAEWESSSSGSDTLLGEPFSDHPFWMGPQTEAVYPSSPYSVKWIRLTFAPDGQLQSWKRYEQ